MHRTMQYRGATARDAEAVAGLHAESWRRHYRGALSDGFLDGEVFDERRDVWAERLAAPRADWCTIVAEFDGMVVGLAHTVLDDDPTWGALLDNLHVAHGLKRRGVGTVLTAMSAEAVVVRRPASGLYLWVLEQNTAAQAFYDARGGRCVERRVSGMPGGGTAPSLRYSWPDPTVLLRMPHR
jgi:ribosomal protein S18 acetylase RimI-like enzyme